MNEIARGRIPIPVLAEILDCQQCTLGPIFFGLPILFVV